MALVAKVEVPLIVARAADLVEVEGDKAQATGAFTKAGVLLDECRAQDALRAMLVGQVDGHHTLSHATTAQASASSSQRNPTVDHCRSSRATETLLAIRSC